MRLITGDMKFFPLALMRLRINLIIYAECEKVNFPDPSLLSFTKENADLQNLKDFDYVINRVTPPFNKEYLYLTQLLDLAMIKCINPTQALREENEKLVILNFPELIPVTKVTNSLHEIRNIKKRK